MSIIINRMEDCGEGRHVGWWTERRGSRNLTSLLVEVTPHTLLISCCEGEKAERRLSFIVNREKAAPIVRAMAEALGLITEAPVGADQVARPGL